MLSTVIAGVEDALNRLLPLDPEVHHALLALNGHVMRFHMTDLNIQVTLKLNEDYLGLSVHDDGPVDATLTGTSWALLQSYAKGFEVGSVSIVGDVDLVLTFSRLMQQYQIDWEELLSTVIGDIGAHKVHSTVQQLVSWGVDAVDRLRQDTSDYLHEEVRVSPPRVEVENFYHDIAIVRADVDRAEARVNRLLHTQESR